MLKLFNTPLGSIIYDLSVKIDRTNALLFKIRKCVDDKILRSIYFAIFESNLNYCSLVWAQNYNAINRLVILQKKALRIMNYQPRNSHTSPLFRKAAVLKFKDKINLENILFISKSINNLLPSLFNNCFFFPLIPTNIIPHGHLMINSKNTHTELTLMVKIRSL